MSALSYIFKRLAKEEGGFFSAYERNYLYRFVSDETEFFKILRKRLPHWSEESIKKLFKPKPDDKGRLCGVFYNRSMPCLLESNREKYPIRNGLCLIPRSACDKCEFKKRSKRSYYCEKLREKNRDLTKRVVEKAIEDTNKIMGNPTTREATE